MIAALSAPLIWACHPSTGLALFASLGRDAAGLGRSPVSLFERLKQWARIIKRDVIALYLATGDPRTPWRAKVVALVITAYAASPIDLIPDIIPILGYLDEVVLLPLGILLAVRLVGRDLMSEFRARADTLERLPSSRIGAALIIAVWVIAVLATGWWLVRVMGW